MVVFIKGYLRKRIKPPAETHNANNALHMQIGKNVSLCWKSQNWVYERWAHADREAFNVRLGRSIILNIHAE